MEAGDDATEGAGQAGWPEMTGITVEKDGAHPVHACVNHADGTIQTVNFGDSACRMHAPFL